ATRVRREDLAMLTSRVRDVAIPRVLVPATAMALGMLVLVGIYAVVKGAVSEKLAVRYSGPVAPKVATRTVRLAMPRGLDDPRWDFRAKEEPPTNPLAGLGVAAGRLVSSWFGTQSWPLAVLGLIGLWRFRGGVGLDGDCSGMSWRIVGVYAAV